MSKYVVLRCVCVEYVTFDSMLEVFMPSGMIRGFNGGLDGLYSPGSESLRIVDQRREAQLLFQLII